MECCITGTSGGSLLGGDYRRVSKADRIDRLDHPYYQRWWLIRWRKRPIIDIRKLRGLLASKVKENRSFTKVSKLVVETEEAMYVIPQYG